ncbi:MAG TPA: formylglycine-generating enzyme family protein, partial [Phycisphaerae bacterium]|nr:formylglycine-generating enzyme family protein [Phycisphaerae bacterium]
MGQQIGRKRRMVDTVLRGAGVALALGMTVGVLVSPAAVRAADDVTGGREELKDPRIVYFADFAKGAGAEWSNRKTERTLAGGDRYLGQFRNRQVHLRLGDLPGHKYVRVSIDLYVLMAWDGSSEVWGPSTWWLKVDGGPALLRTTFANMSWPPGQCFPCEFPYGGACPIQTGAVRVGALGYLHKGSRHASDAVYSLRFAFPHTGDRLGLTFAGENLMLDDDESWGLDNVKVELLPAPVRRSPKELASLWDQLAGEDPLQAYQAQQAFCEGGEQAARFLAGKIGVSAPDADKVAVLITDLDSDSWKVRERAQKELTAMGRGVIPLLRKTIENQVSPEVQARIHAILTDLAPEDFSHMARQYRLLRILSVLRTPGSPATLEAAADPFPSLRLLGREMIFQILDDRIQADLAQARALARGAHGRDPIDRCRRALALAQKYRYPGTPELERMIQAASVPGRRLDPDRDLSLAPWRKTVELGQGMLMELVRVPGGTFRMGSPAAEPGREKNEGPVHEVTISQPFYLSVTEVTRLQYDVVMGRRDDYKTGMSLPATTVTWEQAAEFCRELSRRTGLAVRLPTEAEWEYACRAGTT